MLVMGKTPSESVVIYNRLATEFRITIPILLLCIIFTSGNVVPNVHVKTKDGKTTDIVTGVYYSLFNYGYEEKQRGGLVTFYVNEDLLNQDLDDELTYKTLSLDRDTNLVPGGKEYDSTLFALKHIKGNTYQLYNKKLQAPVTYKKMKGNEHALVIHGLESDMHQQLKKHGKLFNSTLFTLKEAVDRPGFYQLESVELKSLIEYDDQVPRLPRDLLLRDSRLKSAKRNHENITYRHGSYFRFNLADFYDTVPIASVVTFRNIIPLSSNEEAVENYTTLLDTTNYSDHPVIHNIIHSHKVINSVIRTSDNSSHYELLFSGGINPFVDFEVFNTGAKASVSLDIGGSAIYRDYDNSRAENHGSENTISLDIKVEAPARTKTKVHLLTNHKMYKSDCSFRDQITVKGYRLKEDGSHTNDFNLDISASYEIHKSKGEDEYKIERKNGKLYRSKETTADVNQFVNYEVTHSYTDLSSG